MKAKTFLKRELSLFLVLVLLFTCWVFAAPTATKSYAAAGTYVVKVKMDTTNNADSNDNAGSRVFVVCRNKNGADNDEKTYTITGYTSCTNSGGSYTGQVTTDAGYCPTSFYCKVDLDGGGWRTWKGYLTVYIDDTQIAKSGELECSGADLWGH